MARRYILGLSGLTRPEDLKARGVPLVEVASAHVAMYVVPTKTEVDIMENSRF